MKIGTWRAIHITFVYYTASAEILAGKPFWIVNSVGEPLTESPNQTTVYDGWRGIGGTLTTPVTPVAQNQFIFTTDNNAFEDVYLTLIAPNDTLHEFATWGDPLPHEYFADSYFDPWVGELQTWSVKTTLNVELGQATAGHWTLKHTSGNKTVFARVQPGDNDLRWWVKSPQSTQFHISLTRWNHDLTVRCSDGSEFPIVRQHAQGHYTPTQIQQAFFHPEFYFDAAGFIRPGLSFRIWDETTREESAWNDMNLQDWFAILPPWNVVAALAPSSGGVKVTWRAAGGARLHRIERSVNGAWVNVGDVAGEVSETNYEFVDANPVPGVQNAYRVVAVFDAGHTAPSASASINVAGGTLPMANIPLYEQDSNDGLFRPASTYFNPSLPTVLPSTPQLAQGGADAQPFQSGFAGMALFTVFEYLDDANPPVSHPDAAAVEIWNQPGHTRYYVERSEDGLNWNEVTNVPVQSGIKTKWKDDASTGFKVGHAYYYRVIVEGEFGKSRPTRMIRHEPRLVFKLEFEDYFVSLGGRRALAKDVINDNDSELPEQAFPAIAILQGQ